MKSAIIIFVYMTVFTFACQNERPTIVYSIGDSTMANKTKEVYPETGWCQVVGNYFDETVIVRNHAKNGRSSKSFLSEGLWQNVLDSLRQGDYVFIQFGHNDQKKHDSTRYTLPFETFSENLERYVNELRSKGAVPVLFTSIVRRKFGDDGKLIDTHGDYLEATKNVARQLNVPLIDLNKLTEEWINSLGEEPSKEMFLWTKPNEEFPNGRQDNTHLSVKGANCVARMAVEELKKLELDISGKIKLEDKD
jgi:lysophospholipase L1-like esterase